MLLVLILLSYNMYMEKRGFSLIEIVIAIFVASAIFSAAIPLIFNTITANRASRLRLNAYEAAQKEIESIKNQDITTFNSKSFTPSGIPGGQGMLTINKQFPDLADVKSNVTWNFKGKAESVEVRTYIYGAIETQ